MRAYLLNQGEGGETRRIEVEGEVLIGRSGECDVVLDSDIVSARHAKIRWDDDDGCFRLEDLGSRNGTYVGRSRVSGPVRLGPLEVITIGGQHELIFQLSSAGAGGGRHESGPVDTLDLSGSRNRPPPPEPSFDRPETTIERRSRWGAVPLRSISSLREGPDEEALRAAHEGTGTRELSRDDLPAAPVSAPSVVLRVRPGDSPELEVVLVPGTYLVGRSSECNVRIGHETLSRVHARLEVRDDGVLLEDLHSTNGTWVGSERLQKPRLLPVGSSFRFGSVPATLEVDAG